MMSDIDKNIEILEEFKENGFASLMIKYNKNRIQTNTMVKMAIENMLSEFEGLREFSAETVRRNAELQAELEKKENLIKLMSMAISSYDSNLAINDFKNKEDVKQFYEENYEGLMKQYGEQFR